MLSSLLAELSNISGIFQRGCFGKIIILPHCSAEQILYVTFVAFLWRRTTRRRNYILLLYDFNTRFILMAIVLFSVVFGFNWEGR